MKKVKNKLTYIGQNIRDARTSKGLNIDELAEHIDVSESFLGLVERGNSGISVENVINIAKVLNISTDDILVKKHDTQEEPIQEKHSQKKPPNRDTLIALINGSDDLDVDYLLNFYRLYKLHNKKQKLKSKDDERSE